MSVRVSLEPPLSSRASYQEVERRQQHNVKTFAFGLPKLIACCGVIQNMHYHLIGLLTTTDVHAEWYEANA